MALLRMARVHTARLLGEEATWDEAEWAGLPLDTPAISLKAVLDFGEATDDGRLVQAVAVPWFEIVRMLQRDPASLCQIDPIKWEEIIAGVYKRAGFDEVILTPRSGDKGRDVIATKWGTGSIRFFDQVKAYRPGHLVKAAEVREMLGGHYRSWQCLEGNYHHHI